MRSTFTWGKKIQTVNWITQESLQKTCLALKYLLIFKTLLQYSFFLTSSKICYITNCCFYTSNILELIPKFLFYKNRHLITTLTNFSYLLGYKSNLHTKIELTCNKSGKGCQVSWVVGCALLIVLLKS